MATDASAADRLPPPPRPVAVSSLTHSARLVFTAFAVLVLIGSAVGLVRGIVGLHRDAQRLLVGGQIVTKEKLSAPRSSRLLLHYRFQHDGQTYEGTAKVSPETFEQVKEGGPCTVAYQPDDPQDNRLEDPAPEFSGRPRDLASLLRSALAIVLLVGIPWTIFEIAVWRQRDLARHGVLVAALVRERGDTAHSRGGTVEHWVQYDYLLPGRRQRLLGRCVLQQVAWELYPAGTRAPALVDPRQPGRHKLLAAFMLVRFQEPAPQELLDLWAPLPPGPGALDVFLPDATAAEPAGAAIAVVVTAGATDRAQPFFRAIRAAPTDDAPRLVFADWLEEQGDPRGEFIRTQVELATLDNRNPRCPVLRARGEELWRDHGAEWAHGLPAIDGVSWLPFVRGFPCVVTVRALATFVARAEELFAAAPVCGLRLRLERPAGEPGHGFLLPLDLSALAALPETARLSLLDLSGSRLDLPGVETLAASAHFSHLTELVLDDTGLSNVNLVPLARSRSLAALRALSLCGNDLHNQGARVLATAPHLSRLTVLNLRDNHIGIEGARALATKRWLTQLHCLDLGGNWLTTEEMRELQMRWGRVLRL